MQEKVKENKQFMILSAIGIILVVICHLSGEMNRKLTLFPSSSFFIPLFIFISGYFYKEEKEKQLGKYILYKFKKLMIPFFIINLIYGVIVNILKHYQIVQYGETINFYTLFVQPFINNNQFVLNFPAWFVPILFVTTCVYAVIHKFSKKVTFIKDEILLIVFIILQAIAVYYQDFAKAQNVITIIWKVLFFLPFFQIGHLYRIKWHEKENQLPTIPYLLLLMIINYCFGKVFGDLNYDMHEFSGFQSQYMFLPLCTSMTGILFYTRIARILSKWLGENKIINDISNHTSSIMSHHLFAAFILNIIFYVMKLKWNFPYFDIEKFQKGWIYVCEIPGWDMVIQLGYVLLGIIVPLLFSKVFEKIKACFNILEKSFSKS